MSYADPSRIKQLAKTRPGMVRIVDSNTACTPLERGLSKDDVLEFVTTLLTPA